MIAGNGGTSPPGASSFAPSLGRIAFAGSPEADGVYLQARMEPQAECMLVMIGATPEGKKELVGFQVGVRESAQSWRELLVDLKARGLSAPPDLAVGDGALGFWKALEEVFPDTRHQRCWTHKVSNVLNKFPKSMHPAVKVDLREISQAETPLCQGSCRSQSL
jgi:putative transposase